MLISCLDQLQNGMLDSLDLKKHCKEKGDLSGVRQWVVQQVQVTVFEFNFFFATLELILLSFFIWDIDHIFDEHFRECLVVAAGINIVGMY